MKQNTAVDKAMESIHIQFYNTKDSEVLFNIIRDHLFCMYGVGYNEGIKEMQTTNAIKVYRFDKMGLSRRSYESFKEAAYFMKVDPSTISKAVHLKRMCKGYFWKREE